VQRAVNGNNITLRNHLLERVHAASANLLLDLRAQGLVVIIEELLAVEGLETAEHTLTDAANTNGSDNLVLKVELVLSNSGDIPVTVTDLVVGGDEVADEEEDSHDNVLSDGDNIGTSDLSNSNTTVGLVGSVQVDMVRANTGSDGKLEVLGLGQTLSCEVSRVEAVVMKV
jgi:hypothetical protein